VPYFVEIARQKTPKMATRIIFFCPIGSGKPCVLARIRALYPAPEFRAARDFTKVANDFDDQ